MSEGQGWKFHYRYDPAWDAFNLFIRHTDYQGTRRGVARVELQEVNGAAMEPTLGFRPDALVSDDVRGFLQAALDCAWEAGLRPQGFADHTNELTAVRYHLEDMRALAKVPGR